MVPSIMASHPGPETAKQPQTITLPPPCLTVGMMFFFMKCCVGFMPDVTGHAPSKKFNFCLSPQNICPKVLGIIKIFWQMWDEPLFFLVSSGFCLGTLPLMPFLPSLSYYWIMNTDLNWGKWGLQLFRCCSGFFYDLLDESSLRSWINFGRPATSGKVHHCSKFSPFVDNGSDRGSLESQSLRKSRYMSTILFLICSWMSLDRGMMCCSLSMLHFVRQVLFKWFLDSTGLAVIRSGCG